MIVQGIDFPEATLQAFCQRHGVARLALFGSILDSRFGPDSDIDLLVEFLPGRTPGMIGFGGMILELQALLGRRVDLRTPADLSPYLRARIQDQSRLLHAA